MLAYNRLYLIVIELDELVTSIDVNQWECVLGLSSGAGVICFRSRPITSVERLR